MSGDCPWNTVGGRGELLETRDGPGGAARLNCGACGLIWDANLPKPPCNNRFDNKVHFKGWPGGLPADGGLGAMEAGEPCICGDYPGGACDGCGILRASARRKGRLEALRLTVPELVYALLARIGDDPEREGLQETPARVAKAWAEWCSGYGQDPMLVMKTFEDGAQGCDEMVLVKEAPFYSHCFIAGTFVETPRGRIPIEWLKHGDWIYTVNPTTFALELEQCQRPRLSRRNAKLVRVYTDNDTVICTPDHQFLTTDGEWIEARHLSNGMRLASLYRGVLHTNESAYPKLMASRYSRWGGGLAGIRPGGIPEHRFVMGQEATERSPVHHVNELVWDNHPSNLESLTRSEHNTAHGNGERLSKLESRKIAAALASSLPETRTKRAESVRNHWNNLTAEQRAARCAAMSAGITAARNHVVFGVEAVPVRGDVYCLTAPRNKSFFANGMAVHNCEHHMAPFFGTVTVAYIPNRRIIGLSKVHRLVEIYARRLQVQERMTNQIADALWNGLEPVGIGVIIKARHMCIESRGVGQQGSHAVTSALRGVLREDARARSEFLLLARG